MEPKNFISKLDDEKIVAAIAEAEKRTSGEIRVYISSKNRNDALSAAKSRFEKLGMTKTRDRNGVLIFLAPRTRTFAVIGDTNIHGKCGSYFWDEVTMEMAGHLKNERFTAAILFAIEKVGEALSKHFPSRPDDANELPNDVIID